MRKMARQQVPRVTFHPMQTKSKIIEVPVHVILGPKQVEAVAQSIQAHDSISHISLGQSGQEIFYHVVHFGCEVAFSHHFGKKTLASFLNLLPHQFLIGRILHHILNAMSEHCYRL